MYFSFLLHLRERVRDLDQERKREREREKRKKEEKVRVKMSEKRHSLEWIEYCMTWVWNGHHHHPYWNKLLKKKWSEGNQDKDESERVKIGGG